MNLRNNITLILVIVINNIQCETPKTVETVLQNRNPKFYALTKFKRLIKSMKV